MMHRESCVCGMDNLELFQVPPTNVALEESKWIEYYPVSSTLNSDTAPIEFDIKGQGDEYLDLSQTYLQVVCKFTKGDGTNLTGNHSTSTPINNILHSLFTEIDVSLNGKIVTPGTDTYPYKAYLEKLLSYKPRTLETQMRACTLWEKDTPGHMDEVGLDAAVFAPVELDVEGHQSVADSVRKVLIDRLHIDLFQQEKFIPNGVDLRLRFNRAKPQFYMMTAIGSSGKVVILNMLLWVRKVKPTPTVLNAINQRLNSETAKYPLRRVEVKTFTIPRELSLRSNERVKKLEVSINGETISTRPYEPDFQGGLYLRSYLSLYQGLGKLGEDWAPDITLEEYKNGYTLWCIDFTKDQEAQLNKFHLIETGNLRIEVQFGQNVQQTLNCLVYAEFDNLLEINKQREVNIDY
uniref:Uncharacterized protein F54H12.2-like n=1 Tax=Crassostrea virginica TaxID=6565 RepID=A0A8B8AH11_CRAVI|nr:uncharacterized protein F54H12.2-like [Crassostrea virginica]